MKRSGLVVVDEISLRCEKSIDAPTPGRSQTEPSYHISRDGLVRPVAYSPLPRRGNKSGKRENKSRQCGAA